MSAAPPAVAGGAGAIGRTAPVRIQRARTGAGVERRAARPRALRKHLRLRKLSRRLVACGQRFFPQRRKDANKALWKRSALLLCAFAREISSRDHQPWFFP